MIEDRPQQYGGDQVSPVISAIISDAQRDKEQARKQVAAIQTKLDKANADLVEQRLTNVRLEERLSAALVRTRYEKFFTFCSPVAFSAAIDLYKANSNYWLLAAAFGLGLLVISFLPRKGKTHDATHRYSPDIGCPESWNPEPRTYSYLRPQGLQSRRVLLNPDIANARR